MYYYLSKLCFLLGVVSLLGIVTAIIHTMIVDYLKPIDQSIVNYYLMFSGLMFALSAASGVQSLLRGINRIITSDVVKKEEK